MEAGLTRLQRECGFNLEIFDVDADPSLEAQFGERVPVLKVDGKELCHYFLDEVAVRAYLLNFR